MKLGSIQKRVLNSLYEHGGVWPGQWIWDTYSRTEKVLSSLANHGLVLVTDKKPKGRFGLASKIYTITAKGRKEADAIWQARGEK